MVPLIRVDPIDSMFDDGQLRIRVGGLESGQMVTVICILAGGDKFISYAHYTADGIGAIDCSKDRSSGGSYKGVDGMGLIRLMSPVPGQRKGAAFMPNNVTVPVEYQFYVIRGQYELPTVLDNLQSQCLCKCVFQRHLLHPQVARIEVEDGNVRGTLFIPRNATEWNRCHGIIDLYGTRGGINEHRAALLASHGYASLALAYFRYKDLPKALDNGLDLEYFQEATEWLLGHPFVHKDGIAVVGMSLGADLAILLATVCSKVKAVAAINGYHMLNEMWPMRYKGKLLPFKPGVFTEQFLVDGTIDMRSFRKSLSDDPDCIYTVEKSRAQFLFICAEVDQNTDAVRTGAIFMERLRDNGKEGNGEMVILPGSGHMLEPPYLPHIYLGFSSSYRVYSLYGGEINAHTKGQVVMWDKLHQFLKRYLGEPLPMPIAGHIKIASSKL